MNLFYEKGFNYSSSLPGIVVNSIDEIPSESYPYLYIEKNVVISAEKIDFLLSLSQNLKKNTSFVKYSVNCNNSKLFFPNTEDTDKLNFERLDETQFFDGYENFGAYYFRTKGALVDYYPIHTGDYSRKVLFLDRDGVINKDTGYLFEKDKLVLNPEILGLLKLFKLNGFLIIVLTNQSGIARGFYKEKDVHQLHDHMNSLLDNLIDDWFICPYHTEGKSVEYLKNSLLRKPHPGMALVAGSIHDIDFSKSLMVGDKISDNLERIGLKTIIREKSDSFKDLSIKTINASEIP